MNSFFGIFILSLFLSCTLSETKFIRKEIDNENINIKWFYYSHITNQSPDMITVEQRGTNKEILKAVWSISNVALKDSAIVIRLVNPTENNVFTKNIQQEVFGYRIILDSTTNSDELMKIPDGKRE